MSNYILAKRASLYDATGKWVGLLDLTGREQIVDASPTPPYTVGESYNLYDNTGALVGVLDRNGKEQILASSPVPPYRLGESPFLFDASTGLLAGVLDRAGGEMSWPGGGGAAFTPIQFTGTQFAAPTLSATQVSYSDTNNAANFGKCCNFNGTTQYIRFPGWIAHFRQGQNWTIRGRIRTTDGAAGTKIFISCGSSAPTPACNWYFYVSSGTIRVNISGFTVITGTTNIADGAWHDWKVECTGGTSVALTVDGVANGTAAGTYPFPSLRDEWLTMGAFNANSISPSFWFTGQLANVAVFDNNTSGGVPTAPYSGTESGLRAYWKLDGDSRMAFDIGMIAATACTVPVRHIAGSNSMSRSRHIAKSSISTPRITYANFSSSLGAPGGIATITAAVEYAGTSYPITWAGSSTLTVNNNMLGVPSDPVSGVSIPSGAEFFVRTFYTNGAAVVLLSGPSGTAQPSVDTANGEGMVIVSTDQTAATGVLSGVADANNVMRPVLITSVGVRKSFLMIGDSRAHGTSDAYSGTDSLKGTYSRIVGGSYGYANFASPGSAVSSIVTTYASKITILGEFASHIISAVGVNDCNGGAASATTLGHLATIATWWGADKLKYLSTLDPWTTSTDSWATTVNQTPFANEALRLAVNAGIRTGVAGYTGVLETADVAEGSRDAGKWIVNGSPFTYTNDGIHETSSMNQVIAAAIPAP